MALRLAFPSARAANCSSRARELLRASVAAAAGVDVGAVTIERIAAPNAARQPKPHLAVHLHVAVGREILKASALARAVSAGAGGGGGQAEAEAGEQLAGQQQEEQQAEGGQQLLALLGGKALVAALGLPDPRQCSAEIEDVTPACASSDAERAQQDAVNRGAEEVAPEQDRRLAAVSFFSSSVLPL